MATYVAFHAKLVGKTQGHIASLFMRFWLRFTLQTVVLSRGTLPWSDDRPRHYRKAAAAFVYDQPWSLMDGLLLDHRRLYKRWKDCCAAQTGETLPSGSGVEWAAMQPTRLDRGQQRPALAGGFRVPPGKRTTLPAWFKPYTFMPNRMRR